MFTEDELKFIKHQLRLNMLTVDDDELQINRDVQLKIKDMLRKMRMEVK